MIEEDGRCEALTWCGDSRYEFPFTGNAEEASDLLARLVGSGVRVASFSRRKEGLEELFLAIGAKELS